MEEKKYYCDRCKTEIQNYKKSILALLLKFEAYIGSGLIYHPPKSTKSNIDLCQDCNKSFMEWFKNK